MMAPPPTAGRDRRAAARPLRPAVRPGPVLRAFHTAWATNMAQRLNQGVLPEHYYAEPNTQFGAVEIDCTLRDFVTLECRKRLKNRGSLPIMPVSGGSGEPHGILQP